MILYIFKIIEGPSDLFENKFYSIKSQSNTLL